MKRISESYVMAFSDMYLVLTGTSTWHFLVEDLVKTTYRKMESWNQCPK